MSVAEIQLNLELGLCSQLLTPGKNCWVLNEKNYL